MPGTLVVFHAHPDDESIMTAGTMCRAAGSGHRVVLCFATDGALGEVPDDLGDATLAERRVDESTRAAEILGVDRIALLGYRDSGMDGDASNHAEGSFWSADVEEAAARLAAVLDEEQAEVLTTYDVRGNYGHPDHVQVHRVGVRAAELAGTPRTYEATVSTQHFRELSIDARASQPELDVPDPDELDLGVDEALITTRVDVRPWLDRKRAAMAAHASQIPAESFFLSLSPEHYERAFGTEWFIRRDVPSTTREDWLFPTDA